MITFLTGVPGSGKTYKAVLSIFNNFSDSPNAKKDMKKEYLFCYTNINELKFGNLHDTFPLDVDDLKVKLAQLHKLYKAKATDDELIEECTKLNLYKCLFVIDEAHNIFDNNDVVLIWWLSYHRHLYHDIFLITQNLSLIFTKYKSFSEYFFKAKSTTISLNRNTFKYDVYINSRMAMNSRSHTEKLPKLEEVFNLYHSGDSVKASNVLLKFYFFAFIMLVVSVLFAFYYFSPSPKKQVLKKNDVVNVLPAPAVVNQVDKNSFFNSVPIQRDSSSFSSGSAPAPIHQSVYDDKHFFKLSCGVNNCFSNDVILPIALITKFKQSKNITVLYTEHINNNNYKLYAYCSNSFYNFISNKGSENVSQNFNQVSTVPVHTDINSVLVSK